MKIPAYFRYSLSFVLLLCLLAPTAVLALGDGKKHFKEGLKAEVAEQWDKAVEEFALAVAENPKNAEYRLHYTRALFNASQMYMKRGNSLAEEKDYAGAYLAYRKAYAYDPVNELAKAQMEKMLRLQEALDNQNKTTEAGGNTISGGRFIPTGYQQPQPDVMPQRLEKWIDVIHPNGIDLQFLIKELAKNLDLNVLFDTETFRANAERKVKIELRNVTPAKALDYIFLQEGLFFQRVGPRTILVANQNNRQRFQQLVLRTFYLANADPTEVAKVVQAAIPVQPGRTQPIPLIDKATNSLTIRDTEENIKIIGKLIRSLDKDRAEVVMDVNIYEVSKTDLLRLGNQIGSESQLSNLAVSSPGAILGQGNYYSLPNAIRTANPLSMASAILLPSSTLSAFQRKSNTRLLASTQVHAFNNEKSTAKIGQRVPVRSATYVNAGTNNGNNGTVADVITYEQTGLTLEFEPLIFPNQDVQVKMSITSRDLAGVGVNDNPIFGEREIKGSARIQNNRTMMLASVAQNREERGKAGLPLLGLIPIIGRLFATPTRNDNQTDIVIAVTPRVLRAPVILPEDEVERPTGSIATPTNSSLEAMIIQEEREEQLANARRQGNTANVQLPDQKVVEVPQYVKSSNTTTTTGTSQPQPQNTVATTEANKATTAENKTAENPLVQTPTVPSILKPIDSSVKTLQINTTSDTPENKVETTTTAPKTENNPAVETGTGAPKAELRLLSGLPEMKAGEKTKVAVLIKTATTLRSAVLGLKFDPAKVAVRSVQFGDIFSGVAQSSVTPFVNTGGMMRVSLSSEKDVSASSSGILAYIEIEALTPGVPQIALDTEILTVMTVDGKSFELKY
ncbi:MAG: cohesin domain-containing protein [Acidobacteriota bacterium]|nr:cohesin domain-containing protein [Acidobacteriota bacterium]